VFLQHHPDEIAPDKAKSPCDKNPFHEIPLVNRVSVPA